MSECLERGVFRHLKLKANGSGMQTRDRMFTIPMLSVEAVRFTHPLQCRTRRIHVFGLGIINCLVYMCIQGCAQGFAHGLRPLIYVADAWSRLRSFSMPNRYQSGCQQWNASQWNRHYQPDGDWGSN